MRSSARGTPESSLSTSRPAVEAPGPLKYAFVRNGLRFFVRCYVRVRVEGGEDLPDEPYLICFSHPGWLDPILIVGFMPERRMIFIFGPREENMMVGRKNRLIRWAKLGVPFKPSKNNLLETTRRAVNVLGAGHCLAVAGEGRLSDREGEVLPLQDGAAFLALRAGVPTVPVAVIGTRWLRFAKTMRLRIGSPVWPAGRRADRAGVDSLTREVQASLERLLAGVREEPPPGRFARWLTDVFNERPWLEEEAAADQAQPGRGSRSSVSEAAEPAEQPRDSA